MLGVFIFILLKNQTYKPVQEPEWCYFYTYDSKENFDLVKHSPNIFVKINGDKRIIFTKCNI